MYPATFGGIGQVDEIGVNVVRDLSILTGEYGHSTIVVITRGSVIMTGCIYAKHEPNTSPQKISSPIAYIILTFMFNADLIQLKMGTPGCV